jgi:uncharacterized membrane protein HdeD (DUF308 family)
MPAGSLTDDVKKRSTWSALMGGLTAVLGLFLIAYPLAAATIATVLFGWVLIFVGIAQFVFALHSHTIGSFALKALFGALYGIAGVALAFFPFSGVAALTVLLGTVLLVHAGVAASIAFKMRPVDGWVWFLLDAAASFLLGMLILAKWPYSSVWAIGTLVGVSVLWSGICRIVLATKIRGIAAGVERFRAA